MYRSLIVFVIISFFCSDIFAAAIQNGGAELLNPKAYSIKMTGSVFTTSSYFDNEGVEQELDEGNKYSFINFDLDLAYGFSSNVEFSGNARFRKVTSTLNTFSADKFGIESLGFLAKYAFTPIQKTKYALGVYYRQTLYNNKDYALSSLVPVDEVVLGDSGREYGVNFYLTHLQKSLKWDFLIGYRSPANNLSEEILYKAEGMYTFTKLSLLAGVEGIISLKKDPYTDTPFLKPVQANGASHLWNSINREMIAPYLGANYNFDNFMLGIKGQNILSGQSTDKGSLVLVSLNWASEGVTKEATKISSFKEYQIDGAVLKVSARGNFLKIDQGLSTDVEKGMKFDIYQTDYFGGNVLVASGLIYDVGVDWSVIKITKRYSEIVIKPGFAARGY